MDYAREMSKGHSDSPDWLYGGDLDDTTKKCEVAKKIGEKLLKRKQQPQPRQGQKKFRPQGQQQFQTPSMPMFRAFNPFQVQQFRLPSPQQFNPVYQPGFQPMQFGGFPRRIRGQNGKQNQKQGFAKRGGYKQ